MTEVITARLTEDLESDLAFVAKTEQLDKSTVLRRLLATSLHEWKEGYALQRYASGKFSAAQAASFLDTSLWSFFDLLQQKKVPLNYDTEELGKDLKSIQWKK